MANQKLTALTEGTTLLDADLLYLVKDVATTPVSRKITGANLKAGVGLTLTSTATAAGTTTLTVTSTRKQQFTGTTTQTITMPVVSTLFLGDMFTIINNSTGALTVNSSGSNLIATVRPGETVQLICILITGTTAASWHRVGYKELGLLPGQGATLTIAAGVITPTHRYHKVEVQSGTTDDLDTINTTNAVSGDILVLSAFDTTHDVVLKDTTSLRLPADFTLDTTQDTATFMMISSDTWASLSTQSNS